MWKKLWSRLGVDARACLALVQALLLMDLRCQHYAQATASKPHFVISPLFWVVGQCMTFSAITTLLLFTRVDVFFFVFVNLSASILVLAAAVVVEFHEVVLHPQDRDILGHRPIAIGTYTAARLLNLFFYVSLIYAALNLLPLLIGIGLRDAGWWYGPAYLLASLTGSAAAVAAVVLLLSYSGGKSLEGLKALLAWVQIVLILVVGYGGQFMLRDSTYAVQMWGAFPPRWIEYVPTSWLARFVERAAVEPGTAQLEHGAALVAVLLGSLTFVFVRLRSVYARMQPIPDRGGVRCRLIEAPGSLADRRFGWLLASRGERIGFWLCRTRLRHDPGLVVRCLLGFCFPLATVVMGILLGQWANPVRGADLAETTLSVVSVYLMVLAAPSAVYHVSFCADHAGSWLLRAAPLESPGDVGRGMCKALMLYLVTPLCVLFTLAMALVWRDPFAALVHGVWAWALSWPGMLAGLWLLLQALPFSASPIRGAALGMPPLPLAGLSLVGMALATLHAVFAGSPFFWVVTAGGAVLASRWLGRQADRRLAVLWRGEG